MQDVAADEPAHGLQARVRMRRHPHPLPADDVLGTVGVDEAPGADHAAVAVRERPRDLHAPRPERDLATEEQFVHRLGGAFRRSAADRLVRSQVEIAHTATLGRTSARGLVERPETLAA